MELNVTSKKELEQIVKNCKEKTLDERIKISEQLQSEAEVLQMHIQRLADAVIEILHHKKAKE